MTDLRPYVLYQCVIGSRAYGLESEDSDTDVRGIYLPPADLHWGLNGVPDQFPKRAAIPEGEPDEVFYEIEKFLRLALKANPSILEMLFTPEYQFGEGQIGVIGCQLRAGAGKFLSKRVYQTYRGYAQAQFSRCERSADTTPKAAMHTIRLLVACRSAVRTGHLDVRPSLYWRTRLRAIRNGKVGYDELLEMKTHLEEEIDAVMDSTPLPDEPDEVFANDLLLQARRVALWL